MPTGRVYSWDRLDVVRRLWFHRPKILNYPVQGLGADIVAIGRVTCWKRLRKEGIPALFVSTVHDSIDIDVESCYNRRVCEIVDESFQDVPKNFYNLFGVEFDLPIKTEIAYGDNLGELKEYAPNHSTESKQN
jgi:DNA polymerase I-like protein with 3'-5' exonuclease and polymerase domains